MSFDKSPIAVGTDMKAFQERHGERLALGTYTVRVRSSRIYGSGLILATGDTETHHVLMRFERNKLIIIKAWLLSEDYASDAIQTQLQAARAYTQLTMLPTELLRLREARGANL